MPRDYVGPFYKSDRKWTEEIEDCACPDFFPLGDRHMLLMHTHRPYGQCQYYLGRYANERFMPEVHGRMTWPGGQMCAPETLLDDKGRRIFWGWITEAGPRTNGWASVASLPRVLSLAKDGTLRIEPVPELEALRCEPWSRAAVDVPDGGEVVLEGVRGDCLELDLTFEPGSAVEFGLKIRRSPDGAEETAVVCVPGKRTLKTGLAKSTLNPSIRYPAMSGQIADEKGLPESARFTTEQVAPFDLAPGEPLRLRVFLDRSVLEVFANGRQCLTQRIYPTRPDSLGVSLFAVGAPVRVRDAKAWRISPVNSY